MNKFARKELLPVKLSRISDDDMERIISRCAGLSTHALAPVVPLPGATVDSDSEQSDDEPYYEGTDKEDEDRMDESGDSLILQVSDDPEFRTPPRMNNNAPVDQRKNDSGTTSTKRESGKKTVMKKPSYKSGHLKYSIPKYKKTNSDKTEHSRHRSRTRSSSPRRSSPPRGSSSSKKREHKRRGEGK